MRTFYENIFLIILLTIFISIVYFAIQSFSVYEGASTLSSTISSTINQNMVVQNPKNTSAGYNINARQADINMADIFIPQLDDLIEKMNTVSSMTNPENYHIKLGSITTSGKYSDANQYPLPQITITGEPGNQVLNIVLPQGPDGPVGLTGPQGKSGAKGHDGDVGSPGISCGSITSSTPL
jgi:hypothetical protein